MGLFNIFKKKQPAQPQPQPEPKPEKPQARSKWNDPEYLRRVEAALQQGQSKPIMETLKEAEKPAPVSYTHLPKEDKNMLIINIVLALVAALLLFGVIGEKDGLKQQNITIAFVAVIVLIIALNRFF